MNTADLVTVIVFAVIALVVGFYIFWTWLEFNPRSAYNLPVPIMSMGAAICAFSVVMVVASMAALPAWLRVLLALVAGAGAGIGSIPLWNNRNDFLSAVRQARQERKAREKEAGEAPEVS